MSAACTCGSAARELIDGTLVHLAGCPLRCKCWDDPNPPPGARCKLCKRIAPGELQHTCHARGCTKVVKPEMLMCYRHWCMVPRKIQQAVWAGYRVGQCDGSVHPSKEWHGAADAAIGYVAAKDKQPLRPQECTMLRKFGYRTTTDDKGELIVEAVS